MRGFIRMSSGPLRIMLKPRSAFSSWREETPRSRSAPPIFCNSELVENFIGVAKIRLTQSDPTAEMRQLLARVCAIASGS